MRTYGSNNNNIYYIVYEIFNRHGFFCIQVAFEGIASYQCNNCRGWISCAPILAFSIGKNQGPWTLADPTILCLVMHRKWLSQMPHTHQCGSPYRMLWRVLWTNRFSPNHPLWPNHQHSTSCCKSSWAGWRGISLPSLFGSWTP